MNRGKSIFQRTGVVTLVLGFLLLAGCANLPVSRTYLGSEQHGNTAVAPEGWEVYSAEQVRGSAEAGGPVFLQGFGAGGNNPNQPMFGEVPGGVLIANGWVGQEAAKTAARNALLVDLDSQIGNGTAAILEERPTRLDEGWEYNQWMLEVTLSPGTVNRVIQSTAVSRKPTGRDELGREIYVTKSLIVGCSQDCFAQEIESIRLVVDSWEVR